MRINELWTFATSITKFYTHLWLIFWTEISSTGGNFGHISIKLHIYTSDMKVNAKHLHMKVLNDIVMILQSKKWSSQQIGDDSSSFVSIYDHTVSKKQSLEIRKKTARNAEEHAMKNCCSIVRHSVEINFL